MNVITDNERRLRTKELETQEIRETEERETAKKNHDFVQIYRANMPELRWLMVNHSFASSVLFFILEHMDGKNALACSYNVMSEYFNKNRTTIHRAMKILEDNGFLAILKIGTSNVYLVNSQIAWTSYENQKGHSDAMYASIDGNILVSKKENIDYDLKRQSERFKALGISVKSKKGGEKNGQTDDTPSPSD